MPKYQIEIKKSGERAFKFLKPRGFEDLVEDKLQEQYRERVKIWQDGIIDRIKEIECFDALHKILDFVREMNAREDLRAIDLFEVNEI